MARGDKRKRNIKADFTTMKSNASSGSKETINGQKNYKFKKDGLPNLRGLGVKLSKKSMLEKEKKAELVAEALKQRVARIAASGLTTEQFDIQELAQKSATRSHLFNTTAIQEASGFEGTYQADAAAVGKKDNSRKAYYREFKKVVAQADVILEILDARDPLGCRTREVEEMIMNAGADKKIVLILNKIVPRETVEAWLKYLRNEFPTVAFKASTQTQRTNLGQSKVATTLATDALLGGSEAVGADNLVKLLKNYCRNLNIKTSITVGVVGFPNVGKSSVINSLKRSKVCGVGSTPGVTKVAQTIHLDKNINLLDCPGIVFSKSTNEADAAHVLLRNCVKVELLDDPVSPVEIILSRCSHVQLQELYQVDPFSDTIQFLVNVAKARGKLLKGGVADVENAARSVIQDWNQGRIPFYTIPPVQVHRTDVSSQIVAGWSAAFSLDGLDDLGGCGETNANDMIAVDSLGVATVDMDVAHDDTIEIDGFDNDMIETEHEIPLNHVATSVAEIRFKPLPPKKGSNVVVEKTEAVFTADELTVNPQRVQGLRKLAKKGKKDARRAAREEMEDMEVDE